MKINRDELINTIDELIESNGWDDGQGRIYVDADGGIYGYPPHASPGHGKSRISLAGQRITRSRTSGTGNGLRMRF